jgi:hypothetical protein
MQSPSATGTTTINCATTGLAVITPTTASQVVTVAFSNLPIANLVTYVRVQVIAPASGTQSIVWPTNLSSPPLYWTTGVSGQLTALTANKHYEYMLEIQNGVILASIISEGLY